MNEPPGGESVGAASDALLDFACYKACVGSCECPFGDRFCLNMCRGECRVECTYSCAPNCSGQACGAPDGCGGVCSQGACPSGTTCGGGGTPNQCGCTPSCAGAACGASNGCGGTCTSGSCPAGAICGAGAAAGVCTFLPDLVPSITGTLQLVGFNAKDGVYTIRIRNLGAVAATNVEVLMQTNLPAGLLSLTPSGGFACFLPNGFFPRLGLDCVGGTVPAFSETVIQLTTSLSVSGANVLSIIADPNNTIAELSEGADNLANVTLFVP
jgi:hypothetical protein